MNIKQLPRPQRRIECSYLSRLKIQGYDIDNLYPQNVLDIVGQSKTGAGCLERYTDFIEGDGLKSPAISNFVVNRSGEKMDDIHHLVSNDLATFNGFAIHVNYDIHARVTEMHHVPFENVRLCEPDEDGVVKQVAVHPDWSGKLTRGGKRVRVNAENTDYIDVFNPDPEVVLAQMTEAGGPQFYKGQILYFSMAGYLRYPLAFYDAVLTDMSTDEGLSNVNLRNVRNNFLPAGFFIHFKSQAAPDDSGTGGDSEYSETLQALQGDTNALNIMDIEIEDESEMPSFKPFEVQNFDKEFTATAGEVKESIYAKFGQEGFLAIRNGKVGFSGTLVADVTDDYARKCAKKQRAMTRAYMSIMEKWTALNPLPEQPTADSLAVLPITYAVRPTEGGAL